MKIVLASDHAGFERKEELKAFLTERGEYDVVDVGAFTYDEQDDYPDYIAQAAELVSKEPDTTRGIILGGSGQGEAVVANRFPHVRAVVYVGEPNGSSERTLLRLTREHNDANVLSLGARCISQNDFQSIVTEWLLTPFSGDERHVRRIEKIETRTGKRCL